MTHTGIIVESLPVLLALDRLCHHTEQDWNLTKICSRTHVSIITELMRTMTLLLACVHHPLNPQPKAIIFMTMIVAIVFPLRLLWVVWPVTANQLFARFPLRLLLIIRSLLVDILCCRACYIECLLYY